LDSTELERIAAQIGDEILARMPGNAAQCDCLYSSKSPPGSTGSILSGSDSPAGFDRAIAAVIDHTILHPGATHAEVVQVCREARQYGFASVCVSPYWVGLAAAELAGSAVAVSTVCGFPFGAGTTETKRTEAAAALRTGAREIDMVLNVGALRGGDYDSVRLDIRAVAEVCHNAGALLKVILETALLDDEQKTIACKLAMLAGADFVKTSTGFGSAGATVHDVSLMRSVVGPEVGVKAAGGIRTLQDLKKMAAAGANRIGTSASVRIIEATAG